MIRCDRPEKTVGGIIIPNTERQARPAAAARVVLVGPTVEEIKPHEVVLFDPLEALDELVIETDNFEPINLIYVRDDCVILRIGKDEALSLGIPYPNLRDMQGIYEVAKLAGVVD